MFLKRHWGTRCLVSAVAREGLRVLFCNAALSGVGGCCRVGASFVAGAGRVKNGLMAEGIAEVRATGIEH